MEQFKPFKTVGDWISKQDAMEFLGYKGTQMNEFLKKYKRHVRVSKIGRRSFVNVKSLIKVIESHELR